MGQGPFHDALRGHFAAVPLSSPTDYIQSLLFVVADHIWDGDLSASNVPPSAWDDPMDWWFRTTMGRLTGVTLRMMSQRQEQNIEIIDADFNNARAHLDDT